MKSLLAAAALAALTLAPAYADCTYPKPPANLPDGNVATLAQMLAAQKSVQAYNGTMNTYLTCIKKQSDATIAKQSLKLTKKQIKSLEIMEIQRNNAAVDQLQKVAKRFNAQVRIYQKKHAKKSN
jgi:cellobiose phosphorylase